MAQVHLAASWPVNLDKHPRDDISLVFISIGMQGSNRGWSDKPPMAWIYESSNTQNRVSPNAWIASSAQIPLIMEGSALGS